MRSLQKSRTLVRMLLVWVRTVFTEIDNSRAIISGDSPAMIATSTSCSRRDSESSTPSRSSAGASPLRATQYGAE